MKIITKLKFNEFKYDAISVYTYSKGNFWILHSKNNIFYPVRHHRNKYYIGKGTKDFTKVISAIICYEDNHELYNPSNQNMFK